jgi:hypothetical protein
MRMQREERIWRACIRGTAISSIKAPIGISQRTVSAQFLRPVVFPETGEYLIAIDTERLTCRLVAARFSSASVRARE